MYKIMYVCTGNTCRSPMAEGILRKLLEERGCKDVEVSSSGIGTLDGYPATPSAVEVSQQYDIDISDHHSGRLTHKLFKEQDLIFALAQNHYEFMRNFPDFESKVYMVKAFPHYGHPDPEHSVEDPLGGSLEEYKVTFEEIYTEIRRALPEIIRRIEDQKK